MLTAIFVTAVISFLITLFVMPQAIVRLNEKGITVTDMYKTDKPLLPTKGGIIVIFTSFLTLSIIPLVGRLVNFLFGFNQSIPDLTIVDFALLLVVAMFGFYGILDDLIDIGRVPKVFLPLAFSYPLILVFTQDSIWIPIIEETSLNSEFYFTGVSWEAIFKVTILPIYIMVVVNLVNMYSGYNGLQTGLSLIILATLILKSYEERQFDSLLTVSAFFGSMLAFYIFNKFPLQIFEGNIGALTFGAVIGGFIAVQKYWWFGFFILIPHTLNFLLWLIYLLKIKQNPKKYLNERGTHHKFGKIREDGTIQVPNRLTLKWIPNYYFRLTEGQSTYVAYTITIIFCLLGLLIF